MFKFIIGLVAEVALYITIFCFFFFNLTMSIPFMVWVSVLLAIVVYVVYDMLKFKIKYYITK